MEAAKTGRNRLRLHVAPVAGADQHAEVDRLVALGATRLDPGREEGGAVAMADPDGNEFSVFSPR